MFHHVALVRTDVLEELVASIRVTRIGELATTLAVTINTRRHNPEDGILHDFDSFGSFYSENFSCA
jgi:hypothetical protein